MELLSSQLQVARPALGVGKMQSCKTGVWLNKEKKKRAER
jgi:hypothetical protein